MLPRQVTTTTHEAHDALVADHEAQRWPHLSSPPPSSGLTTELLLQRQQLTRENEVLRGALAELTAHTSQLAAWVTQSAAATGSYATAELAEQVSAHLRSQQQRLADGDEDGAWGLPLPMLRVSCPTVSPEEGPSPLVLSAAVGAPTDASGSSGVMPRR